MSPCCCSKKSSLRGPIATLVYFIINIRVEAGIATLAERILDGMVALAVFVVLGYIWARFLHLVEDDEGGLFRCDYPRCLGCNDREDVE